ncbi:hypothetical protein DSO57_1031889 [Entomophthora muscae]|uniref:Uncharacterized protein n=1 Tax=Entomophthora muscae TaxID=34485 RepID=A0ACC2T0K6_9FUNG|nr:hypothetical protein DSO57_1031889 [Entomophthora muscae]
MGLHISKLTIQALAVSHLAIHCSAAPTKGMNPVDANAVISGSQIVGIDSSPPHNRASPLESLGSIL